MTNITTTTTPTDPVTKAQARVLKAQEAAARAIERAKKAQATAEQRLATAGVRDEITAKAKEMLHEIVSVEAGRRVCLCGCGEPTPRAFFRPGHDARALSAIVKDLLREA